MQADHRNMERFPLEIPVQISRKDGKNQIHPLEMLTRDICAGGAFIYTEQPFDIGTEIELEFVIDLDSLKNFKDKKAAVQVTGKVIRSSEMGMGVCFQSNYKIQPII